MYSVKCYNERHKWYRKSQRSIHINLSPLTSAYNLVKEAEREMKQRWKKNRKRSSNSPKIDKEQKPAQLNQKFIFQSTKNGVQSTHFRNISCVCHTHRIAWVHFSSFILAHSLALCQCENANSKRTEPNGKKTIPKHKTFKGIIKNQASTRHLAKRSRGCNNNRREHTYYNNDRKKKL